MPINHKKILWSKATNIKMARWEKIKTKGNVEDRRAYSPAAVGGLSVAGIAAYLVVSLLLPEAGVTYQDVNQLIPQQTTTTLSNPEFEGEDTYEVFAATVVGSLDTLWTQKFAQEGLSYQPVKLVLFRQATESGCGGATTSVGPHYCPLDKTIYLDETFFDELQRRFGGSADDVAQAYVIAHEAGHYVQDLLGITNQVQYEQARDPRQANNYSIAMELQADCYAGVWANSVKDQGVLLPGEIEEAISAAAAVGDDNIQKTVTGRVTPETWNHGSSEQRVEWFTQGFTTGNIDSCDTFFGLL